MAWVMAIGYICAVIGLLHVSFYLGDWIGVVGAVSLWAIMSINTWAIALIVVRRT